MLPVSVLDLSPINVGATIAESFAHSVELAQTAERLGINAFGLQKTTICLALRLPRL